jgi:phosphoglucosamine mutase
MLEAAFVAGLASAGVDPLLLGVAPTPAVAWVSADADIPGAVISASHNPFADNGIKLFAAGGRKLPDELETAIEGELIARAADGNRPTGADVGSPLALADHVDAWAAAVAATLQGRRLDGMRVVLDCANGAAAAIGPEILDGLGAEVHALHARPDGTNINAGCGATHTGDLRRAVVDLRADVGLALDGDADRCIAVDGDGREVDGDQILAILALSMREAGTLRSDTVVATVMANLGFKLAMEREGVAVVETAVGDRYVLEAMKAGGFSLGGEQSGHVVMLDQATTGDGVLTALHLLARVAACGKPLAELAAVMDRLPQILVNVPGVDKTRVDSCAPLTAAVAEEQARLGATGRVLLRPSGTEPLVRVMVEAPTQDDAKAAAERLADVVRAELSLPP